MISLSAADAISPAIERTRILLFRPFQLGTFLKLCAVAVITEGFGGNLNGPGGGNTQTTHSGIDTPSIPSFHFDPALIAALIVLGLSLVILGIVLFYVVVRLRFALFDCLVHQTKLISPGWQKYRYQAFRFFLLSIVVGLVFFAIVAAIAIPVGLGIFHLVQQSKASGQFPLAGFLALLLPVIPIFLLLIVAAVAVDLILRDFMLPHIALENASAGQAWAAVRARILAAKGPFLLYAVLRVFLPAVAMIGLILVLAIPAIVVIGIFAVVFGVLHAALSDANTTVMVVGTFFEVVLIVFGIALGLLAAICVGGPLCIAIRNYSLLFYGGRYQALGDILSPPPSPAPPLPEPSVA